MFSDSPYYPKFREAILTALKTETDTWNLEQLLGLAKEMVAHGDEPALEALREHVIAKASHPASDDWLGADEWIELRGADGLLELARVYGQRLILDPGDYPYDGLPWLEETWPSFKEVLLQHALPDEMVKAYYEYLERQSARLQPIDKDAAKRESRRRFRERYSLEQIVADASAGVGEYPGNYARFGGYATPEELDHIYTLLMKETNGPVRLRLLWVFRRAPVPELSDVLFDWANGPDRELRAAAIAALSQVSDARVHELARSKMQAGALTIADREILDLFLNNYRPEDAQLVMQALTATEPETDEAAHSLSFSIELAERHAASEFADMLKWAYEKTPCSNCRYQTVVLLDKLKALNAALVNECLHDAAEETREFAQKGE